MKAKKPMHTKFTPITWIMAALQLYKDSLDVNDPNNCINDVCILAPIKNKMKIIAALCEMRTDEQISDSEFGVNACNAVFELINIVILAARKGENPKIVEKSKQLLKTLPSYDPYKD